MGKYQEKKGSAVDYKGYDNLFNFWLAGFALAGAIVYGLAGIDAGHASVSMTSAPRLIRMSRDEIGKKVLKVNKGESFFIHFDSRDKDGISEARVYVDGEEWRRINNRAFAVEIGKYPQRFYTPAGGWRYDTSGLGIGEHFVRCEAEDATGRVSKDIARLFVEYARKR